MTKPGGLAILSYTVWLGPFGGHETGLWHCLAAPGRPAATRRHGHPPKNYYRVVVVRGLSRPRGCGDAVHQRARRRIPATTRDGRGDWCVSVPWVREFLVSNLVLVLRPS